MVGTPWTTKQLPSRGRKTSARPLSCDPVTEDLYRVSDPCQCTTENNLFQTVNELVVVNTTHTSTRPTTPEPVRRHPVESEAPVIHPQGHGVKKKFRGSLSTRRSPSRPGK